MPKQKTLKKRGNSVSSRSHRDDSSEKRNLLAQTLYGSFTEPHESEMKNLTEKENLDFELIPGRDSGDMEFMNYLNCRDRARWCLTQGPGTCASDKPGGKYTYSCRLYNDIDKMIKEDIIGLEKPRFDYETFEDILLNIDIKYDKIMNLNFKTYIESFSSYGSGVAEYEFYIKCDVENNPVLLIEKEYFKEVFQYVELLVYIENDMWSEEEFLHLCEKFILLDSMVQLYEDNILTNEMMRKNRDEMNKYQEGSLSWWVIALGGQVYAYPKPNKLDPEKSEILNELFRSDAEMSGLFTGKCFEGVPKFSYIRLNHHLVKDIIEYFRDNTTRKKAYDELKNLMDHIKKYGESENDYMRENLVVDFFFEFVKLISFDGGGNWTNGAVKYEYDLTNKAENTLEYALNERILRDQKTS